MGALVFVGSVIVTFFVLSVIDRVRMARVRRAVLVQLVDGERFGAELVKGSGGLLRRSSCFVVLADMEHRGLIVGRYVAVERGLMPRRLYGLTQQGRTTLG